MAEVTEDKMLELMSQMLSRAGYNITKSKEVKKKRQQLEEEKASAQKKNEQIKDEITALNAYKEEKDKLWTLFTDPPFEDCMGVLHWIDGLQVVSVRQQSKIAASQERLAWQYKYKEKPINPYEYWRHSETVPLAPYPVFLPGEITTPLHNLWRPWQYTPIECDYSIIEPMDTHLKQVFCNNDAGAYRDVIKFLAHLVQRPAERVGVALLIRGAQGTGKGFTANYFGKLFEPHFYPATSLDNIAGRYNSRPASATFIYVDNTVFTGGKPGLNRLKTMITQPKIEVEDKFVPVRLQENFTNYWFASNEKVMLPLDLDDRRYPTIETSDAYARKRLTYFDPLFKLSNTPEAYSGWMYKLANEPISDDDFSELRQTQARVDGMLEKLDSVTQWWIDLLKVGSYAEEEWPEESVLVPRQDLYTLYSRYWNEQRAKFIKLEEGGPLVGDFGKIMFELNPTNQHRGGKYGIQKRFGSQNMLCFRLLPIEMARQMVADALKLDVRYIFGELST